MSVQTGHIEVPAAVLDRQRKRAGLEFRKHATGRPAESAPRVPSRRPHSRSASNPQTHARDALAPALPPPSVDHSPGVLLLPLLAVLVMVGDVIVVGAVGRLWILIPAIAVDLLVILTLTVAIWRLLANDGDEDGHGSNVGSTTADASAANRGSRAP